MYKFFKIIVLALAALSLMGCGTTSQANTCSLVYYVPSTSEDYYEAASFSIGKTPFESIDINNGDEDSSSEEYSPLDVMDDIEESEYEPISMVSPLYEGSFPVHKDEGIGYRWKDVYVSLDDENSKTIDATCVYASEYAYFYVDDSYSFDVEQFKHMGESFDSSYELVRSVFGEEADIDGNGHVRFLITEFDESTMGFYYPLDQYSQEELDKAEIEYHSNLSDVLYINALIFEDVEAFNITDVYSTLAHEFSHMVYFNERDRESLPYEESMWISEGLAMWCEYFVGLPVAHQEYIYSYLSIADEVSLFDDKTEIYGFGLLFFRYLEDTFGLQTIIDLTRSPYIGTEAVADATGYSFEEVFRDFVQVLLATSTYTDSEYYLDSLNQIDKGFVLSDVVFSIIAEDEGIYNLGKDYSYSTDLFYPFSLCFFLTSGDNIPDFKSDYADMFYIKLN